MDLDLFPICRIVGVNESHTYTPDDEDTWLKEKWRSVKPLTTVAIDYTAPNLLKKQGISRVVSIFRAVYTQATV